MLDDEVARGFTCAPTLQIARPDGRSLPSMKRPVFGRTQQGEYMSADLSPHEADNTLTLTERAIATLWKQILDCPDLPSPSDNFFEAGGDSTAMVMLELRISEEFLIDLPTGSMLNASSLREISQLVDDAR